MSTLQETIPDITLALIVVFAGISFIPLLAEKIKLPVIVLELLFGVFIGVSFLNLMPTHHPLVEFLSSFGLAYLLFLAGIEAKFGEIKKTITKSIFIGTASLLIPFLTGYWLSSYVGIHPMLLGTVFATSSLGLVIPVTRGKVLDGDFSKILFTSIIISEIGSILLLGITLSYFRDSVGGEILFSLVALSLLLIIPWKLSTSRYRHKLTEWFSKRLPFDSGVRLSFALILILGTASEGLGFETIIGAFIAGMIVSQLTPDASQLEEKLESFGYGFFIPLFFVFIGAKTDVTAFFTNGSDGLGTLGLILLVGIGANILAVFSASRLVGFRSRESLAMGFFHATLLSLTIAAAEITSQLGLITSEQFSMFIVLAIVSAIIAPTLGGYVLREGKHFVAPLKRKDMGIVDKW